MAGDELDQFLSEVLEAKKLSGLNDDVRAQLLSDLKQQLLDQINRALINALPEDSLDSFNELLDNPNTADEEIQQFIMNSGVDIRRVTTETMLLFRGLYLQTPEERENQ